MKVIIAGSRSITAYWQVRQAIHQSGWAPLITEVVSGHALGVDRLGERWAEENNLPIKKFEVTGEDWKIQGKGAGCIRNREMASYAMGGALILIWDGQSKGSASMLREAKLAGLLIFELITGEASGSILPKPKTPRPKRRFKLDII